MEPTKVPAPPAESERVSAEKAAVLARWPKAFEHDGEIFVPDTGNRKAYLVGSSWAEVLSERPAMMQEQMELREPIDWHGNQPPDGYEPAFGTHIKEAIGVVKSMFQPVPAPPAESERPETVCPNCMSFPCLTICPNKSPEFQQDDSIVRDKKRYKAVLQLMPWIYPEAEKKDYKILASNWAQCDPKVLIPIAARAIELQLELSERVSMSTEKADLAPLLDEMFRNTCYACHNYHVSREASHTSPAERLPELMQGFRWGHKSSNSRTGYTGCFASTLREITAKYAALLKPQGETSEGGREEAGRCNSHFTIGISTFYCVKAGGHKHPHEDKHGFEWKDEVEQAASVTPEPAEGRADTARWSIINAINTLSMYNDKGNLCRVGCNCDRCAARKHLDEALRSLPPSEPVSPQCPSCKQIVSFTLQHLCGDRYVCVPQGERSEFQRRRDVSESPQPKADAVLKHEADILSRAKAIVFGVYKDASPVVYEDGRWTMNVGPAGLTRLGWSATERELWIDLAVWLSKPRTSELLGSVSESPLPGRDAQEMSGEYRISISETREEGENVAADRILREVHDSMCMCGNWDECDTEGVQRTLLEAAHSLLAHGNWSISFEDGWIRITTLPAAPQLPVRPQEGWKEFDAWWCTIRPLPESMSDGDLAKTAWDASRAALLKQSQAAPREEGR